jgi:hypothetical protein
MQIEIGISLETDFGSIADMAGLATSSTRSRITMRRFFAVQRIGAIGSRAILGGLHHHAPSLSFRYRLRSALLAVA